MKNSWNIQPIKAMDKKITILGPDGLTVWVDFDDVDPMTAVNLARKVETLLNAEYE